MNLNRGVNTLRLHPLLIGLAALLVCALSPAAFAVAQPTAHCPSTVPSGASAILAAAEACLEAPGPFYERDAARALMYAQEAVAAQLEPAQLAHAYDLQAEAHFWLGELGQAIARQTQAVVLVPTADRYLMRAVTMDRVGDTAGAIADGEQAISLAPRQIEPYLWLGRYALDQREYELALDVGERAAAFAADDADIVLLQADAYYGRADYASAKAAYERYVTLASSVSPVVAARLMIIERRLGS